MNEDDEKAFNELEERISRLEKTNLAKCYFCEKKSEGVVGNMKRKLPLCSSCKDMLKLMILTQEEIEKLAVD